MLRLAPRSWLTTTDERLGVTVLPPLRASSSMCTRTVLSVPRVRYHRPKPVSPAIAAHQFLENLRAQQGKGPLTHAGLSGVWAETGEPTWETLPFFMAGCSGVVVESFLPFS